MAGQWKIKDLCYFRDNIVPEVLWQHSSRVVTKFKSPAFRRVNARCEFCTLARSWKCVFFGAHVVLRNWTPLIQLATNWLTLNEIIADSVACRCDGGWSHCPRLPFWGYNEQWVSCAVVRRGSWAQASPWRCSRSRDRNTSIGRSRLPPVSFRYFTFDHNTPGGKLSRQPLSWLLSPSFHVTALADQYMCIFTALQTSWRCFAVENLDSATFKMFLRKRSNIPASSLSTPKPKKSVSNQFFHTRLSLCSVSCWLCEQR